jgi:hypothetical protein
MNLHTPERLSNESQAAYRERRAASAMAVKAMTTVKAGKSTGRELHRDALRQSGGMAKIAGSYGRGLRNWINRRQAQGGH